MIDLIIIGAGPCGMAAAIEATQNGLSTLVLNEGPGPGGRIYHGLEKPKSSHAQLGKDYTDGAALLDQFRQCGAHIENKAAVFRLDPDGTVWFTQANIARTIKARAVLIATGAMERPVPIPGWTLPGVMTAGAAQMMLKGDNAIPTGTVVLAGCGPLLLLTAIQLLGVGVQVTTVIDTVKPSDYGAALPHLLRAIRAPGPLFKGLGMVHQLSKANVELISGASSLAISGTDHANGIDVDGRLIAAGTILLHNGVVPETQLSRQVGCEHIWNQAQRCWQPKTDQWGVSSLPSIHIAGDGGGIGGALAAVSQGHISALNIASQLGKINLAQRNKLARPWQRAKKSQMAIRPFLDRLYQPADFLLAPSVENVIVCRCEDVTVGDIINATALGCPGPNQLKAFTRAGMGPCQGRMCGLTISELMARQNRSSPDDVGYYNIRPPIKPVTLDQLAQLTDFGKIE